MASTNQRGSALCSKLEELHEQYAQPSATPTATAASTPDEAPTAATPASGDETPPSSTAASTVTSTVAPTVDSTAASTAAPTAAPRRTPEEILAARAERLSRLEQQCSSLFSQMSRTSRFGDRLSSRLEELHEQYGAEPTPGAPPPPPPPLPAALPARRLSLSDAASCPEEDEQSRQSDTGADDAR